MNWRIILYLFIVPLLGCNGLASESESTQLDETCASYTLSVVKPLLEHFEETKVKTEKNDVEIAKKNDRISVLTREVHQLRAQIESYSYKDKEIKLCEANVRTSANLIESLKQEIQLATKSTERMYFETQVGDKKGIY